MVKSGYDRKKTRRLNTAADGKSFSPHSSKAVVKQFFLVDASLKYFSKSYQR